MRGTMPEKRGFAAWFEIGEGAIGPPVAHAAAAVGVLLALGLARVLGSMGYLSRPWGVALIVAGYAIPFAIARDRVRKRQR